jgi:hypothetical protein
VRVEAALDAERAKVAVNLDDVSLWLEGGDLRQGIDLSPHPDIVDPRRPSAKEPAPVADRQPARPIELTLVADDSIWVRREDFAVKVSAELGARVRTNARSPSLSRLD